MSFNNGQNSENSGIESNQAPQNPTTPQTNPVPTQADSPTTRQVTPPPPLQVPQAPPVMGQPFANGPVQQGTRGVTGRSAYPYTPQTGAPQAPQAPQYGVPRQVTPPGSAQQQAPSYRYPKQYQPPAGFYNQYPNPNYNYPQNRYPQSPPYGMPYNPYFFSPEYQIKQQMKKDVGYGGLFSTILPLAMNVIALIAMVVVMLVTKAEMGDSNYGLGPHGYQIFNGAIYLVSFLLCIIFVPRIFKRKTNPFARYLSISLPADDKKGPGFIVLLASLLVALALCIVANIVTSLLLAFLMSLGLPAPVSGDSPNDALGLGISIVLTAIFPAIFEEIIWRGHVLRALRPYGDFFAVVVSSLFFGLMHGNVVQIPFAFMVGLICGWLVIKTNSIWPSVAIHFLNNFMAVILNHLGEKISDIYAQNVFAYGFYAIIIVAGIVGLIILFVAKSPMTYFKKQYRGFIQKGKAGITFSSGGFWVCVIVAAAFVLLNIFASSMVSLDDAREVMLHVLGR